MNLEVQVTFAAENLGDKDRSERATYALCGLLRHPSPLVREGAINGLSHPEHLARELVAPILRDMAVNDPSPGVKSAAKDAIDEIETEENTCSVS